MCNAFEKDEKYIKNLVVMAEGKKHLEDPDVDVNIQLKHVLKSCELNLSSSAHGPMACSCRYRSTTFISLTNEHCLDMMNDN